MVKSLLLAAVLSSQAFSHDLEIKINGLVCSSCGIGIKRGFKREINVNDIKFDVKKQLALVDLKELENGISPGQACVFYNKDKFGFKVLGGGWIKS